jgi:methyl-accepting chemotaxis protein
LESIVVDIKQSDKLMGDITKSSAAQEETVGQMKSGVERVSAAVQQSNTATEQSVNSLESISREAIELSELVSEYRLKPGFAALGE